MPIFNVLSCASLSAFCDPAGGTVTAYLVQHERDGIAVVVMDDPSGRTNRTTAQFKAELGALLDRIEVNPPRGVVFTSAKPGFGAGGDIAEVLGHATHGASDSRADSENLKALFRRIERLACPVVAAVGGLAVGGGWELALACHARFCLEDPSIRLGLPEVALGLVPGGGGLVRLPHMIGGRGAGRLIGQGLLQGPQQALASGLLTGLASTPTTMLQRACDWIAANPDACQPWDLPGHQPQDTARYDGPLPGGAAPGLALEAIANILAQPFDAGSAIESELFARLAVSAETQALIGLRFQDRNTLRRHPVDTGWAARFATLLTGLSTTAQAAAVLQELRAGRVHSAAAANTVSVQAGFPATTGGVLRYLAGGPLSAADAQAIRAAQEADLAAVSPKSSGPSGATIPDKGRMV
ncbi:MAG: enoyl-CoA hydratase-related protein [Gemmobacter sp.]|nr:enoyl-CoA hydratase-related protein [Gemmobacter sp.]